MNIWGEFEEEEEIHYIDIDENKNKNKKYTRIWNKVYDEGI